MIKTDYDKIAKTYDNRYSANYLINIENHLRNLISENSCTTILETGCGTGRWISALKNDRLNIFGLDYSFEMLKLSKDKNPKMNLVNSDAVEIPFKGNLFDLTFCVNAIHHFPDKDRFTQECKRILKNNGTIAIYGVDPHIDKNWYVYDYFDSVYENDLKRFIPIETLKKRLEKNNFVDIEIRSVEKVFNQRIGVDVFYDPFLRKKNTSQLANLTNDQYEAGINKITNKILENPETVFTTSLTFYSVTAKKGN
jgi:ubiquinone/menaquinone biosynthesis C-methylase UbiE